jgi:ATPase family associated with various cellular activities (AAA)
MKTTMVKPRIGLSTHTEDLGDAARLQFLGAHASPQMPLITAGDEFIIERISLVDLAVQLAKAYPQCTMLSEGKHAINLTTLGIDASPLFIQLYRGDGGSLDVIKSVVSVTVTATPELAKDVMAYFETQYSKNRKATVDWYYMTTKHGVTHLSLTMDAPPSVHQEYYPYINDVKKYFQQFLESNSTVLFMSGIPGTGKTSLLRAMIYDHGLHTMLAYDHRVLEGDELFTSFLSARGADILVLEDSEEFLRKRDNDNQLMSKFLNVSDGIVKPKDKKIIFTTNFREFKDIDEALLRPGRTYGMMKFRALTYDEAVVACQVGGLPVPAEDREYTLAELFNQNSEIPKLRKAGF